MKYVVYVNGLIKKIVASEDHPILFGQNFDAGSSLSGLTRGLKIQSGGKLWNSTNAENSLVGFGFGIMMNGGRAGFFMKQMDFLLLGIDQLVNTYNIIRSNEDKFASGSFTILAAVVDSGYEGPQSSLNNFADFCSIAHLSGFAITNKTDADILLPDHLMRPGFRLIGVSQRLEKLELIDPGAPVSVYNKGDAVQYSEGDGATIVSFNFSFSYGWQLKGELEKAGIVPSFFNVNAMAPIDWDPILASIRKTKKLLVIDDSKSVNLPCLSLIAAARKDGPLALDMLIRRELDENWLRPTSDAMDIDYGKIVEQFKK